MTDAEIDDVLTKVEFAFQAIPTGGESRKLWLENVGRPCAQAILAANNAILLEQFAGRAMQALLPISSGFRLADLAEIARTAYNMAECMVEEHEKREDYG